MWQNELKLPWFHILMPDKLMFMRMLQVLLPFPTEGNNELIRKNSFLTIGSVILIVHAEEVTLFEAFKHVQVIKIFRMLEGH